MSARKAQEPRSASVELAGERADARDQRRLDLLAVGLANRPEARHGRDRRRDLREDEGLKARPERQTVAGAAAAIATG